MNAKLVGMLLTTMDVCGQFVRDKGEKAADFAVFRKLMLVALAREWARYQSLCGD